MSSAAKPSNSNDVSPLSGFNFGPTIDRHGRGAECQLLAAVGQERMVCFLVLKPENSHS
jgi:hypothetical protein